MSIIDPQTYTTETGETFRYDARVTETGARVSVTKQHVTREVGDDSEKEVTVLHGALGTVQSYVHDWFHVHVSLDRPANGVTEVWVSPDDLAPAPARFTLDKDAAARDLAVLADAAETGDWQDASAILSRNTINRFADSDAEAAGFDYFEPIGEDGEGPVSSLLKVAYGLWVTGPAEPHYWFEADSDGGGYRYTVNVGEHPAQVRLSTPWQDAHHIVSADETAERDKWGHTPRLTGVAAAVDLLEWMVSELNAVLNELDNYVKERVDAAVKAERAVLDELIDAADDDEDAVIDTLRIKAGHLWRCDATPEGSLVDCGWRNTADETECGGCGTPREGEDEGILSEREARKARGQEGWDGLPASTCGDCGAPVELADEDDADSWIHADGQPEDGHTAVAA